MSSPVPSNHYSTANNFPSIHDSTANKSPSSHDSTALDSPSPSLSRILSNTPPPLSQVRNALSSVLKTAQALSTRLNQHIEQHPVLAMSLGIAGALSGGALCVVQPIAGAPLLATSAYLISKSLKPVFQKLAQLLTKHRASAHCSIAQTEHTPVPSIASDQSALSPIESALPPISPHHETLMGLLDPMLRHVPDAGLALKEALLRNKEGFSHLTTTNPMAEKKHRVTAHHASTQFLLAKTGEQLPEAKALLDELYIQKNPNPKALNALNNLLNRHTPNLVDSTIKAFQNKKMVNALLRIDKALNTAAFLHLEKDPAPVIKLGNFLNTVIQEASTHSNTFWARPLNQATLSTLHTLYNTASKTHQTRLAQNHQDPAEQAKTEALHTVLQTMQPWLHKVHLLAEIRAGKQPELQEADTQDPEIISSMIQHLGGLLLHRASAEIQNTHHIVLQAVQATGLNLRFASDNLKNNDEIVLAAVKGNGKALQYASDNLKNNPEIVLAAVKKNGEALQYASESLKNNEALVSTAVQQNANALQYASPNIRADRDLVTLAVRSRGEMLRHADESLQADPEVVRLAVSNYGKALEYAHPDLLDNKEIVQAAVSHNGWAIGFASEELRNDFETAKIAVSTAGGALSKVSPNLQANKALVLIAVQKDGMALQWASNDLREDNDVVRVAVSNNGHALEYAGEALQNDRSTVRAAVQKHGMALRWASDTLKNDFEIVSAAVRQNRDAFSYANPELRRDKRFWAILTQRP